jgi:hypothetical protein
MLGLGKCTCWQLRHAVKRSIKSFDMLVKVSCEGSQVESESIARDQVLLVAPCVQQVTRWIPLQREHLGQQSCFHFILFFIKLPTPQILVTCLTIQQSLPGCSADKASWIPSQYILRLVEGLVCLPLIQ